MPFNLSVSKVATTPLLAGIAAALIIGLLNLLYRWKTKDTSLQNKTIAYNSLIGAVLVTLAVVYAKKSLLIPDELLDTRPPSF